VTEVEVNPRLLLNPVLQACQGDILEETRMRPFLLVYFHDVETMPGLHLLALFRPAADFRFRR